MDCADRARMAQAMLSRKSWVQIGVAAVAASLLLASCGGFQSANGTTTSTSMPPLTNSFQIGGVRFSAPRGFILTKVGHNPSTAGALLDEPSKQGRVDCPDGMSWEMTAVFFTSAAAIQGVSGDLHKVGLGHGLNAEGDTPIASAHECKYVTQHIILPDLGVGMAISGNGMRTSSALALAREIVSSATLESASGSG